MQSVDPAYEHEAVRVRIAGLFCFIIHTSGRLKDFVAHQGENHVVQ